ncbi:MAG: type IV toxin-antitoxin system AbiEi family antitoxin [Pseudolysinimonas sp.]
MPHLPSVLDGAQLPLAERMAAVLDGELYPLGGGHCPVDEVPTPTLRLAAALAGRHERMIAELGTAAWVWGALTCEPELLELCVDLRARARPPQARHASVREVVVTAGDLHELGGRRVTTPVRTAVELARARERFGEGERETVRELGHIGGFGLADCVTLMNARRNLPAKRRAIERLTAAFAC